MKFGYLQGYIVTATDEGTIDLNAKVVCKADEVHLGLMQALLTQANDADEAARMLAGGEEESAT